MGPRNAVAAAELKTVHRTVFLTLRPSQVQVLGKEKKSLNRLFFLWSRRQDLNLRHLGPKRTYEGTFRRKWLFPPLSAWKTALFGTLISTVSECSETVGGLLCGQQQFPQNNTHYTPLVIMREAIAFYTVIITLNNP